MTFPPVEETNQVLLRYDVSHAHNVVYTYDELRRLGVEPEFLLALVELFEDQSAFRPDAFAHFPLPVIIDYLQKTHRYYLQKKLMEIEQTIHLLATAYPVAHPVLVLLNDFYKEYRIHLQRHIEMEERDLLPYILELCSGSQKEGLAPAISVQEFIDQHHDTEKDLQEVRDAIQHYSPPEGNRTLYRVLLSQLQVLEKDLAVHALMEDEVLLPRALVLEKQMLT